MHSCLCCTCTGVLDGFVNLIYLQFHFDESWNEMHDLLIIESNISLMRPSSSKHVELYLRLCLNFEKHQEIERIHQLNWRNHWISIPGKSKQVNPANGLLGKSKEVNRRLLLG
ncbi:hypothetical protein OROMI_011490 [Orobanche minor]